jgi:hypothetical protein
MPAEELQLKLRQCPAGDAHSTPESILLQEIVTAMRDAEHFARTAKPVNRPPDAEPEYRGMAVKQWAQAKTLAGRPLTNEEEDAMLFGSFKRRCSAGGLAPGACIAETSPTSSTSQKVQAVRVGNAVWLR